MFRVDGLDFSPRRILRESGGREEGPPPFQSSADLRRIGQLEKITRVFRIGKGIAGTAYSRNVLFELVLSRKLVVSQKQHVLAEVRETRAVYRIGHVAHMYIQRGSALLGSRVLHQ